MLEGTLGMGGGSAIGTAGGAGGAGGPSLPEVLGIASSIEESGKGTCEGNVGQGGGIFGHTGGVAMDTGGALPPGGLGATTGTAGGAGGAGGCGGDVGAGAGGTSGNDGKGSMIQSTSSMLQGSPPCGDIADISISERSGMLYSLSSSSTCSRAKL